MSARARTCSRANANWPSAGNCLLTLSSRGKIDDDPVVSECTIEQALARNSDVRILVKVKVVDNQQVNALALPGGFVFIHTSSPVEDQ